MKLARVKLAIALSFLAGCLSNVSAEADNTYRPVLHTDKATTAAKLVSDDLVNSRYVLLAIRTIRTEAGKRTRITSDDNFAIDCVSPRRLKLLSMSINKAVSDAEPDDWFTVSADDTSSPFRVEDLKYQTIASWTEDVNRRLRAAGHSITTPDPIGLAAEYACRAKAVPVDAREDVAFQVNNSAGLSDTAQLECSFARDGGQTFSVAIGFNETDRYVRWNHRWMSDMYVRENEIGINNGTMKIRINRRSGSMLVNFGESSGSGTCAPASNVPKKF